MLRRNAFFALVAVLVWAWGCNCQPPPPLVDGGPGVTDAGPDCTKVDKDGDGSNACAGQDCDDNDATVAPGKTEVCDGKDNDCNGQKDDNPQCQCTPGSPPQSCGENDVCQRTCQPNGQLTDCLPPGASIVDTKTDPNNCGLCGHACATPLNSAVKCAPDTTATGKCGRGPCNPGKFDLDTTPGTFGCEATCDANGCVDQLGNTVRVDSIPLPETGAVFWTFSSGGSFGGPDGTLPANPLGTEFMRSATHKNYGVLGEPTPPLDCSAVVPPAVCEMQNATHKNRGGFSAAR